MCGGLLYHDRGWQLGQGALGIAQHLYFTPRRQVRRKRIIVIHMEDDIVVSGGDGKYLLHSWGVSWGWEGCWMRLSYTGMKHRHSCTGRIQQG